MRTHKVEENRDKNKEHNPHIPTFLGVGLVAAIRRPTFHYLLCVMRKKSMIICICVVMMLISGFFGAVDIATADGISGAWAINVDNLTNGPYVIKNSGSSDPFDYVGKRTELFTEHYIGYVFEQYRRLLAGFISPGATGTISGTVKYNGTGLGIPGAAVTANGYSDPDGTDINGDYIISNVPIGTSYTVTASKYGYTTQSQENVVVLENQTAIVNFQLTEAPDLVGFWHFGKGSEEYFSGAIDEVTIYNRTVVDSTYPRYDVNEDGKVDILDTTIVVQHFGEITS